MNPLSGVLDEAWRMYKTFARHLLPIAFIIYLGAAVVAALLALLGTVGILLGSLVSIIAAFLLQATLVKAVQDVRDGRADMSISETVSAAMPYIWTVAGASILAGIAIAIGLFLLIVPGLFLITIWAVIVPVIVIERSGVFAAFGRSRELVRGRGWHVFGTLVLVFIIMLVVDILLGIIFAPLHPHALGSALSSIISGTLISPFLALVVTLVYYRLSSTPVTVGAPNGGYQQQDSGPHGGYQPPPQSGGSYGGYQPPQGGGPYGGYQPPQGGGPYGGDQPPQGGGPYGGDQPPPQGGGPYGGSRPPQDGGPYGGSPQ